MQQRGLFYKTQNIANRSSFIAFAKREGQENGKAATKLLHKIEAYLAGLDDGSLVVPILIRELKGIIAADIGSDRSVQCEKAMRELSKKYPEFETDLDDHDDRVELQDAKLLIDIAPLWLEQKSHTKKFVLSTLK